MQSGNYQIIKAKPEHLQFFYKQGPFIISTGYDVFYSVNPDGFLVGVLDNQCISKIICLKHDTKYGYLGGYFVRQQYRKNGYGSQLFKQAMRYLEDCELIILCSFQSTIPYYEKWGFKNYCKMNRRILNIIPQIDLQRNTIIITSNINMQQLLKFDQKYIPYNRQQILKQLFKNNHPFVSLDKVTKQIIGYACIGQFKFGYLINILIAVNNNVAEDLIKETINFYSEKIKDKEGEMRLEIQSPEKQEQVLKLVTKWFPSYLESATGYLMFLNRNNQESLNGKGIYSYHRI